MNAPERYFHVVPNNPLCPMVSMSNKVAADQCVVLYFNLAKKFSGALSSADSKRQNMRLQSPIVVGSEGKILFVDFRWSSLSLMVQD